MKYSPCTVRGHCGGPNERETELQGGHLCPNRSIRLVLRSHLKEAVLKQ